MSLKIDLSVNWWKEFIGSCLPCSACYECFLKSFYLLYEILLLPSLLLRRRDGSPIARLGILSTGWIKVERTESTSGACDSHADPNFCLARVHRCLAHDCKVPVSFGSRPAKQMLFPFALILVRDLKYSVFYYFKGYIFFPIRKSRPIVN